MIDLAQPGDQLLLARLLVEFAGDEGVLMAQRIDDVHGEHEIVELYRLRERSLGHLRADGLSH